MQTKETVLPQTMKAIEIKEFGGPENLKKSVRPIPEIKGNEILIKVSYAGVNRPDLLQRQGNYKVPPTASDLPGLEVSGTVVKIKNLKNIFSILLDLSATTINFFFLRAKLINFFNLKGLSSPSESKIAIIDL